MATPEDLKMNAEYIIMADNFIEIPGGSSHNNYSNESMRRKGISAQSF